MTRPAAAPRTLRIGSGRASGDRFGLLLLVLVLTYLLSAFTDGAWVSALQVLLFLTVMLLALRNGRVRRRTAQAMIAVTLAGSAVAIALVLTRPNEAGAGVANLWTALVLLLAVGMIVRRVLSQPAVTLQSIYGAVSAYMILGLIFAAFYGAMYKFGGDTFFAHASAGNVKTFQYFSFTTLTTLGYGDYTAAGSGGRAVAVLEAMCGQIFLATLVARLVAAFRGPRQAQPAPGPPAAEGRPPARRRRWRPPAPGPRSAAARRPRKAAAVRRRAPASRPGRGPE